MLFGLSSTIWKFVGGGLALVLFLGAIFFVGKDYGQKDVQTEWDKSQIEQLAYEVQEQKRINEQLMQFNEDVAQVSNEVTERVTQKTNTITEVRYRNRDVIRQVFQETPFLSEGWVYAHNQISLGADIDPFKAADVTPSTFTEEDSLRVIGNNYATAQTSESQVSGWIDFYDGVRAASDSVQSTGETDSTSSTPPSGSTKRTDTRTKAPRTN
jgi:hypothetical protein